MILDLFRLDDRAALVTGARQGLGQAMAIALAEAGAHIVSLDRSEPDETREAVTALGRRFWWLKADLSLTSVTELRGLVDEALAQAGRLDILVNNAGINPRIAALEVEEADWDRAMQVNLKSSFFLAQAAGRHFASQRRGKIVNVASVLSLQGGLRVLPYTTTKHGILGYTRLMANELAPLGVNVNALAPGYMRTRMTQPLQDDPERNPAILSRIPAGRWGAPSDLGGAVVFLASAASDYVHGSLLVVDGGWLSR